MSIDGDDIVRALYNATLDIIDAGMDALYIAEIMKDAIDDKNLDRLRELCEDLKPYVAMHHAYVNTLQKLHIWLEVTQHNAEK